MQSRGTIVVDGEPAGQGPQALLVSSHADHVIEVGDKSCRLVRTVGGGWILLDVLSWGVVVGLIVDAATGEWSTVDPSTCTL
ncbi:MAG TPA: hypothetical protein VMJ10_28065 [Kofleriaceae bacterium]|nr:hypothetical protein [Kofleriaceae bacterium]